MAPLINASKEVALDLIHGSADVPLPELSGPIGLIQYSPPLAVKSQTVISNVTTSIFFIAVFCCNDSFPI